MASVNTFDGHSTSSGPLTPWRIIDWIYFSLSTSVLERDKENGAVRGKTRPMPFDLQWLPVDLGAHALFLRCAPTIQLHTRPRRRRRVPPLPWRLHTHTHSPTHTQRDTRRVSNDGVGCGRRANGGALIVSSSSLIGQHVPGAALFDEAPIPRREREREAIDFAGKFVEIANPVAVNVGV